jgi:hypothetical protein
LDRLLSAPWALYLYNKKNVLALDKLLSAPWVLYFYQGKHLTIAVTDICV